MAASNTIARPSLREISAFRDFVYVGGYVLEGNPNLHYSQCVNLDLRWELFPDNKENFAATVFGKYIDKPIEK